MLFVTGAGTPGEIIDAARKRGTEPLLLPPYPALPFPVSAHADLLIHPLDGRLYTWSDYYVSVPGAAKVVDRICERSGLSLCFISADAGDAYPADVCLCAKRIDDFFIVNPQTATELFEASKQSVLYPIAVKQGYAACSAAQVGKNALITADSGIAKAAVAAGLNVLDIQPGGIDLPGYRYGFIGGASGFCSRRGEVWLCGDPSSHPDGKRILSFIHSCGSEAVLLSERRLYDCGGIFFF
ncbi:MAG: hypothetical protein PUA74_02820 [Clostridiales bacterium]|nr:hypothetical protein [Clostridiales bacterium]